MFKTTNDMSRIAARGGGFLGKHSSEEGLPPEVEEGNIEYKLKLVNIPADRLEHLVTQMKWRLSEGSGEALYEIGIADNGQLVGLSQADLAESLRTLQTMAEKASADCSIVRKRAVPGTASPAAGGGEPERTVVEVLVRKRFEEEHFLEIQIALMGGSDAGKSTILGVLTHSETDNGFGRARSRAFNHKHELESGRTSSISHELVGFDSEGRLINFATPSVQTPQHICERSSKIVTLLDTCGHSRYLPTTLAGITAARPHYAMLVVNAAHSGDITREHLGLILVLRIPLFIVVTKIDATPPEQVRNTLATLVGMLKGPGTRLVPIIVKNEDDLVATMPHMGGGAVVPIFLCSSVTGANVPLLVKFLNLLQVPPAADAEARGFMDLQFQVRDVYEVPTVGTVIGGQVLAGTVTTARLQHQALLLGPFEDGRYRAVRVKSIHRFCRPVQFVKAGQSATLAISFTGDDEAAATPPTLRRGMVLLSNPGDARASWTLDVQLHMLYHATELAPPQTAVIYCGSVRQAARVVWVERDRRVRTGDRARVRFRFLNHPEYLAVGATLLAREGRAGNMKCVGTIEAVGTADDDVEAVPRPETRADSRDARQHQHDRGHHHGHGHGHANARGGEDPGVPRPASI
ncbi:hypothetical protein H9P43_002807 [Blastocladiella emersonii ATCC 22665]|nr:hypothetical protein H9P43_002807 [Blastocladiella emersonii ATCC 22665]